GNSLSPTESFLLLLPYLSSFFFFLSFVSLYASFLQSLSLPLSLFSAAAQIFPVLTLLDPDSPPCYVTSLTCLLNPCGLEVYVGKTHKQVQESKITKVVFG
ncbi:hypothetical protein IGI04_034629, partial [Brassica rapa subsp. trilocularis]